MSATIGQQTRSNWYLEEKLLKEIAEFYNSVKALSDIAAASLPEGETLDFLGDKLGQGEHCDAVLKELECLEGITMTMTECGRRSPWLWLALGILSNLGKQKVFPAYVVGKAEEFWGKWSLDEVRDEFCESVKHVREQFAEDVVGDGRNDGDDGEEDAEMNDRGRYLWPKGR